MGQLFDPGAADSSVSAVGDVPLNSGLHSAVTPLG
jgi:hypothetical protein